MLHATVHNACDIVSQEFFIQTSYFGTEENVDNDWFTISPNPNAGDFTVSFGDMEGQVEVVIYDAQGRHVDRRSGRAADGHWSWTGMPSGLYFVKALADGKNLVRKVMVNR